MITLKIYNFKIAAHSWLNTLKNINDNYNKNNNNNNNYNLAIEIFIVIKY